MRFPISTIAVTLLTLTLPNPGLAYLPDNCLPCAPLCAYNQEWCHEAECFTEALGGVTITAICNLSLDLSERSAEHLLAAVPSTMVTVVKAAPTVAVKQLEKRRCMPYRDYCVMNASGGVAMKCFQDGENDQEVCW